MLKDKPLFSARANGKFLITGEYFVLDGAKALAIPLKYGQELSVQFSDENTLTWQSLDKDGKVWMQAEFEMQFLTLLGASGDQKAAQKLEEIFQAIRGYNPSFLAGLDNGINGQIIADFDLSWGLGSSSTLIWLLAQWAQIDTYKLQFDCFGGSGYDIACAGVNSPIIYERWPEPKIESVDFNPSFKDQLFFVYLNQKQNSREGIAHYRSLDIDQRKAIIAQLDQLTQAICANPSFNQFCESLILHEEMLSKVLQMPTVQSRLFPDFDGVVKSMGAWGGDFVLVASRMDAQETKSYFGEKGFGVMISWADIV